MGAVLHLYGYLKKHPRSKLVFDPSIMDHDTMQLPDWSDFYKPQSEVPLGYNCVNDTANAI